MVISPTLTTHEPASCLLGWSASVQVLPVILLPPAVHLVHTADMIKVDNEQNFVAEGVEGATLKPKRARVAAPPSRLRIQPMAPMPTKFLSV